MKRILLLAMALVCAVSSVTSCTKDDEEELVAFTGDWKFTGVESTADDDLDILKYYIFKVGDKDIRIYAMDKTTLTTTLSYTRSGNKVTFTPAFNGKYGSATLRQSFGTGKESISWDCGNGQIYYFDRL